jgi:hypothetical protein
MAHIRRKVNDTPSPTNRLAYIIVITDNWQLPLEQHPHILNNSDIYEISNDSIPEDTSIWSIEYESYEV